VAITLFIGVMSVEAKTVSSMAPSVDSDGDPVWSLDGSASALCVAAEARDTPQGYSLNSDKPHLGNWVADASRIAKDIWDKQRDTQGSFPKWRTTPARSHKLGRRQTTV